MRQSLDHLIFKLASGWVHHIVSQKKAVPWWSFESPDPSSSCHSYAAVMCLDCKWLEEFLRG